MFKRSGKNLKLQEHFLKKAATVSEPDCEISLPKLADDLGVTVEVLHSKLPDMEKRGWVSGSGDQWRLTRKGWNEGRSLLRAHRIYESYLAEQTGLEPGKWHQEADRREHQLDSETVNRISLELNRPRFDPHGDAIPTKSLAMPEPEGLLLSQVTGNGLYRILHMEDEPAEPFKKLVAAGLAPDLIVHAEILNGGRFLLQWAGLEHRLDSAQAASLTVVSIKSEESASLPAGNLYSLRDGEEARIHSVSPAVRGLERRRLLDLGFVPGSEVLRESVGAFKGPLRFRVRGTVQALRQEQAAKIFIQ